MSTIFGLCIRGHQLINSLQHLRPCLTFHKWTIIHDFIDVHWLYVIYLLTRGPTQGYCAPDILHFLTTGCNISLGLSKSSHRWGHQQWWGAERSENRSFMALSDRLPNRYLQHRGGAGTNIWERWDTTRHQWFKMNCPSKCQWPLALIGGLHVIRYDLLFKL